MASKPVAALLLFILHLATAPPQASGCTYCSSPPHTKKPPRQNPPSGGGGGLPGINPQPSPPAKCSADILKLGLCLDVLGGLVHVGLGDPVENMCCPVLQGLLELEAAVCLCTTIRLKVLNLNIFIPLALNVLVTCGKEPPPGYLCDL